MIKPLLKKFIKVFIDDVGLDNASSRDEWVKKQLAEIPAGKRILDAGAGECRYKPDCAHLNYTSQDFCQYTGTGDGKGIHLGEWDTSRIDIVSDIANIPAPDESFDFILCTEVFEHIFNPEAAIAEFSRLLVHGGRLILTAPFCSLSHMSPYHFCTGFNQYWYERALEENNFIPVSMTRNGNYFEYIAQELYRVDYMGKRYSGKRLGLTGYAALFFMLRKLRSMSINDKDSGEVLCFGYHVIAEKK